MLFGGALARAVIRAVVGIHAKGDARKSQLSAQRFHGGEKRVLAVEAAVGVVALVVGALQFAGLDNAQRNLLLARKGLGLFQVSPRQTGRVGQHGQHTAAQNAMRRGRQVRGVHAAGVGHHQAAQLSQALFQGAQLLPDIRLAVGNALRALGLR